MRTLLTTAVSSLLLLGCAPGSSGDAADGPDRGDASSDTRAEAPRFDDPEVARIYRQMMERMAPDNGFTRARYIEFDWVVDRGETNLVRSHRWDRWEGDYRLEAPAPGDAEGRLVAIFDVDEPREGQVWIGGEAVAEPRADSLLDYAYSAFINDSYWLLMPYKWGDEGVTATYLGTDTVDGTPYEVVQLTFESVGLTPQNKYRAYVNLETGLMERWNYFRNAENEEPDIDSGWTQWEMYGPIMLSSGRPGSPIRFENLRVETTIPEEAFLPPDQGPAGM